MFILKLEIIKSKSFLIFILGDDQFLKFLNNQIQNEKENMIKVSPPLNGWSLEQTGTNCLLSKDYNYDR